MGDLACMGSTDGAFITSFTTDQVWYSGTVWTVRDGEAAKFEAMFFGKLRCRVWALLHGYGWLKVR